MIHITNPLWLWGAIAMTALMIGMVLTAFVAVYFAERYFNNQLHNECDALTFIINKAGIQNLEFKAGLARWAISDGCK